MPRRCVAANCDQQDRYLFEFPDPEKSKLSAEEKIKVVELRRLWILFVKAKRDKWQPSKSSVLCYKHFTDDCILNLQQYNLGFSGRLMPKKDAVPTIHLPPPTPPTSTCDSTQRRPRGAWAKRENRRLVEEAQKDLQVAAADEPELECDAPADDPMPPPSMCDQPSTPNLDWTNVARRKVEVTTSTKAVQTPKRVRPYYRSVAIQCVLYSDSESESDSDSDQEPVLPSDQEPVRKKPKTADQDTSTNMELEESFDDDGAHDDMEDEDYLPEEDLDIGDSDTDGEECSAVAFDEISKENIPPLHEPKYIVFESSLLELFTTCLICSHPTITSKRLFGTMVTIRADCTNDRCGSTRQWDSQPKIRAMPILNILLSGGILFSGSIPSKVLRLFNFLNIQCFTARTFYRHQVNYLHTAVETTWKRCQAALMESLKDKELVLGGDGRCDSMGHSAKFGSYVLMELDVNKLLSIELVQSNEVKSSYHMELEGLKRSAPLMGRFTIKALITDRHRQIAKWIREHLKVPHFFDCWHVVKGLCKHLEKTAKTKAFAPIRDWIKNIKYHLYWCVMSTEHGDGDTIKKKWLSCVEHIQNKHKNCSHGRLKQGRKWLKEGTPAGDELNDKLTKTLLVNDIAKMSSIGQTSGVESYHSVLNHFAPKMIKFSHSGMYSRLRLAGLHYNENAGRPQAVHATTGESRYRVDFPKYKTGGFVVKKILVGATYGYVEECFEDMMELVNTRQIGQPRQEPPPLCADFVKPIIPDAVAAFKSRFNSTQ